MRASQALRTLTRSLAHQPSTERFAAIHPMH
jgi:hypothetical protein